MRSPLQTGSRGLGVIRKKRSAVVTARVRGAVLDPEHFKQTYCAGFDQ